MHLGLLYDSCDIDSVEGCNQELISRCFGDFGGSANGGGAAMDPSEQRARGLIRCAEWRVLGCPHVSSNKRTRVVAAWRKSVTCLRLLSRAIRVYHQLNCVYL